MGSALAWCAVYTGSLAYATASSNGGAAAAEDQSTRVLPARQMCNLHGMYEIALNNRSEVPSVWLGLELSVNFTRPDGSSVLVPGYYDGRSTFRARAYCDMAGNWTWVSAAPYAGLQQAGSFSVLPLGSLPGKLRVHVEDRRQLQYANGSVFLHQGDTGYRYLVDSEPLWKPYIDQSAQAGATKIRVWFCKGRHDINAVFEWGTANQSALGLALPYWQEMDRRLLYALEAHPSVQLEVIVYGEDRARILTYPTDPMTRYVGEYAQARWSALPNVYWVLSNDQHPVTGPPPYSSAPCGTARNLPWDLIDTIGRDFARREPWGTLISNHQCRTSGFAFGNTSWAGLVLLEDLDQVAGTRVAEYYRSSELPIIVDEDRYELYKGPEHPLYFFRRLMWGNLLSGGAATYGGLLTYLPYDGNISGVSGYFDAVGAGKLRGGMAAFPHIAQFFRAALGANGPVGMLPSDQLIVPSGTTRTDAFLAKCLRSADNSTLVIYLANPTGTTPQSDDADGKRVPTAQLTVDSSGSTVGQPHPEYRVQWFNPATGAWPQNTTVRAARSSVGEADQWSTTMALPTVVYLTAPGTGDWVAILSRTI